jgi:hypothetical protein
MKHDVFYSLRRQNMWITVSGALMGLPFLIHAVYYLLVRSIVDVHIVELAIFMIAPMFIELLWCLLLLVMQDYSKMCNVQNSMLLWVEKAKEWQQM